MQSWLEVLSTPTAEDSGTLVILHTGDKNYILGQLSEGTSRSIQSGTSLRNVSDIFLSGKLNWNNIGGLCGIALMLAELKAETLARLRAERPNVEPNVERIKLSGPTNLTYALATMRRFIFRTGVPLDVTEIPHNDPTFSTSAERKEPTWSDRNVQVWSMPITPEGSTESRPESRKRSYSELQEEDEENTQETTKAEDVYKSIVHDMFSSNWSPHDLVSRKLAEVKMPAAIFVRNPETGAIDQYSGPLPGGEDPVPDLDVLVRLPWPGARIHDIDPVQASSSALSYIVAHHTQRGKFFAHKAKEHKVPRGPLYSILANGTPVQNSEGETITPEMVMEPSRPGRGFAVLDIPSSAYIQPLLSRSEWADPKISQSLEAVVWILGDGVHKDCRIQQFQKSLPNAQHIVSSKDSCPDSFSYKQAVEFAWLRNYVDPATYPEINLQFSENNQFLPSALDVEESSVKETTIRAEPGLRINLEPKPNLHRGLLGPPLDISRVRDAVKADADRIGVDITAQESNLDTKQAEAWLEGIPNTDAEVITLGTGSGHPGLLRNVSGTLVRVPGQGTYLLDCGEGTLGTLRRMFSAKELGDIMKDLKMIWISHLHADHHLGITSVIREWSRTVYGNTPTEETHGTDDNAPRLAVVSHSHMLQWLKEYSSVDDMGFSKIVPIAILPANEPQATLQVYKGSNASVAECRNDLQEKDDLLNLMNLSDLNSVYVNHCYGAMAMTAMTKSGFRFSYSGDCRPNQPFTVIGKDSHVLIHEATFEDNMYGEARGKKHSTAGEALIVADRMEAKSLILTHISQRYYHSSTFTESLKNQKLASNGDKANGNGVLNVEASPEAGADVGLEPSTLKANSREHALEVNRILDKNHTKVISAYDYMRVTVKEMPNVQNMQPILDLFSDNWGHLTSQGKEAPANPIPENGDGGP